MYQNRKERARSYFFNMRRFHNMIKRNLYDRYTSNIDALLDLACGKGGDLDKWVSNNIKNVVGYDINEKSIREAKRRVLEYRNIGNTSVEVHVKDLSRNVVDSLRDNKFDVVTSMFAFHYFFESSDTFNTIIKSIENNLKFGGYFIGTMFDGESIKKLVEDSGEFELRDNNELRFRLKTYQRLTSEVFGNRLSVFLKDTVLDEPMDEYVVYFDKFVELMKVRGFELVESKMFNELYDNLHDSKLNDIEKRISFLNRTFVFKRRERLELKEDKLCKKESEYLTECDWTVDMNKMIKSENVLDKYIKALNQKIDTAPTDVKRDDYIFIRDNFLNEENVLKDINVAKNRRDYLSKVYLKYLEDLKRI